MNDLRLKSTDKVAKAHDFCASRRAVGQRIEWHAQRSNGRDVRIAFVEVPHHDGESITPLIESTDEIKELSLLPTQPKFPDHEKEQRTSRPSRQNDALPDES
ncbi:MAG: hypothetical protein M3167_01575 [Acidobacteriota bacterium]|nr:hypothetical protein [Acidobacteriota bacterium]